METGRCHAAVRGGRREWRIGAPEAEWGLTGLPDSGRLSLPMATLPDKPNSVLDPKRYYELKILEHVEERSELPRRVAAGKLGVSVKLAHKLLSGLVERGLLHVRKENPRRWLYFLTPAGIAAKARLTREFIQFSFEFYREARRRSAQVCRDLSEAGRLRVAFLGLGELAEITYLGVQEWDLALMEVYDGGKSRRMFFDCKVQPLGNVTESSSEAIIVTAFDRRHPTSRGYLPPGVKPDGRMVWVFAKEARPQEPEEEA